MKIYTDEFFENTAEQIEIKSAILSALPEGVYYHNLIIVLAEMLSGFTRDQFEEEIFNKSTERKQDEK